MTTETENSTGPKCPSSDEVRQSLTDHVASKGEEVRLKYGPHIGWTELQRILGDRSCVRYPCEVLFHESQLRPGEFAHAVANGNRPEDGFNIFVHPYFATQLSRVPYLVLYQLVLVNYGEFVSSEEAEIFGANVLGISKDDYYDTLCSMADEIAPS